MKEGVMHDYINAGYWPALPEKSSYFFSQDLLKWWQHLKFKLPGTSEGKFLETREEISRNSGRVRQTFPDLYLLT